MENRFRKCVDNGRFAKQWRRGRGIFSTSKPSSPAKEKALKSAGFKAFGYPIWSCFPFSFPFTEFYQIVFPVERCSPRAFFIGFLLCRMASLKARMDHFRFPLRQEYDALISWVRTTRESLKPGTGRISHLDQLRRRAC